MDMFIGLIVVTASQVYTYVKIHLITYCKYVQFSVPLLYLNKAFFYFCFLGLHPQHMKVPRLGIKTELQLPAYPTTTATRDQSHICNLHHSSSRSHIPNLLSKARIEPASSWILFGFISTLPQAELQIKLFCKINSFNNKKKNS